MQGWMLNLNHLAQIQHFFCNWVFHSCLSFEAKQLYTHSIQYYLMIQSWNYDPYNEYCSNKGHPLPSSYVVLLLNQRLVHEKERKRELERAFLSGGYCPNPSIEGMGKVCLASFCLIWNHAQKGLHKHQLLASYILAHPAIIFTVAFLDLRFRSI